MELLTGDNLIALLTLTALEIVLGIDNVVFIAILCAKLPVHQQARARRIGLLIALVARIVLLFSISWLMRLTEPIIELGFLPDGGLSGRDIILAVGGLFLVGKATYEIHEKMEGSVHDRSETTIRHPSYGSVLFQILLLDIVFSLDSVITAVGMVDEIAIMVTAVIIAVVFMIVFADSISAFIEKRPTFKILALSFLILIGVMLVVEGFGGHVEKGYIYFAIAFSVGVELVNQRVFGSSTAGNRRNFPDVNTPAA